MLIPVLFLVNFKDGALNETTSARQGKTGDCKVLRAFRAVNFHPRLVAYIAMLVRKVGEMSL